MSFLLSFPFLVHVFVMSFLLFVVLGEFFEEFGGSLVDGRPKLHCECEPIECLDCLPIMTIEVVKRTRDYEFAPNVLTFRYHVLVEVLT